MLQPRGALIANNGDVLREAALAGAGIVLLPDFIVGEDVAAGRLETALPDWRGVELGIQAVWPSGRHLPSRLRLFLDFLAQALSRPAWADAAELPALSGR